VGHLLDNSRLFREPPFSITYRNRVVADVVKPGESYPRCEKCDDVTSNVMRWRDGGRKGNWMRMVLCNKCTEELT